MNTTDSNQPETPAEAETSRAPKLGLVHGSAGLVVRLRAMAESDQYAINDWSEDILRQAADEIEKAEAGWDVIEAMRAQGWHIKVASTGDGWIVTIDDNDPHHGRIIEHGPTMQTTACLAALRCPWPNDQAVQPRERQ